ncbi:MAG: hypothetical protein EXR31_00415 [Betaproteobacteria bacterium]|nr:hypothetical protein [Betaproteobacteria bacterium]
MALPEEGREILSLLRLSVLLALCALSGVARADWTLVVASENLYSAYADRGSIQRNGDSVTMLDLYDFGKGDRTPDGRPYFSTTVLREYNCAGYAVRILSYMDYAGRMGEGDVVSSVRRVGRWEPVHEGAMDEAFWKIACGKG